MQEGDHHQGVRQYRAGHSRYPHRRHPHLGYPSDFVLPGRDILLRGGQAGGDGTQTDAVGSRTDRMGLYRVGYRIGDGGLRPVTRYRNGPLHGAGGERSPVGGDRRPLDRGAFRRRLCPDPSRFLARLRYPGGCVHCDIRRGYGFGDDGCRRAMAYRNHRFGEIDSELKVKP